MTDNLEKMMLKAQESLQTLRLELSAAAQLGKAGRQASHKVIAQQAARYRVLATHLPACLQGCVKAIAADEAFYATFLARKRR